MSYLHKISLVFRSNFGVLVCLIVRFMSPFLLLHLVLLILRDFVDFDFVSRMQILRLCGSKRIAKEALRHLTRINHGQFHSRGGSSTKEQMN